MHIFHAATCAMHINVTNAWSIWTICIHIVAVS